MTISKAWVMEEFAGMDLGGPRAARVRLRYSQQCIQTDRDFNCSAASLTQA